MFTNIYRGFLVLNETGNGATFFMNVLKYLHHRAYSLFCFTNFFYIFYNFLYNTNICG